VPESCFEQIADGHCRQTILGLPRFESNEVRLGQLDLGSVLDQKDPFILGDELSKDFEQSRFARPGSTADEDVPARKDIFLEPNREIVVERSGSDHAVVSTLVTVVNTPNVNVANTVPVTGAVGINGNVPVANPLNGSGNPISLGVETDESSPVELTCQENFASGYSTVNCSAYTVPSGQLLIIDDVSLAAGLSSGQPAGAVVVSFPYGNAVIFALPLEAQGSTSGLNYFVAAQRTHLYSVAGESVSCNIGTSTAQTASAEVLCTIVGHLVPAH
jgi:hypothetical protein